MIFLALSILCSTIIVLLFKAFPNYQVNSFQAIVVNYGVCFAIGLGNTSINQLVLIPQWSGLPYAILLGFFFIALFYLMARTTQVMGITVTSVAQKLSFVIPGVVGMAIFNESTSIVKIVGLIIAIYAVILVSLKDDSVNLKGQIWMPIVVFLGSGACDLLVKIIESFHLGNIHSGTFTVILFGTAFVLGLLLLVIRSLKSNSSFPLKSLIAGITLGIPNYGSIYFLVKSLQESGLESSQVFPINNVGIILLSSICAWIIFKEYLNKKQLLGLTIALIAIFILI